MLSSRRAGDGGAPRPRRARSRRRAKCARIVDALNESYAEPRVAASAIEEVGGGYQLRTLPELAPYVQQLEPVPPLRMSRAALETLAIIAYKQPVTRAEIEHVRGVDAGPLLRGLLERRLVRIAGHREVPGRPILYATTPRFLEIFGLAGSRICRRCATWPSSRPRRRRMPSRHKRASPRAQAAGRPLRSTSRRIATTKGRRTAPSTAAGLDDDPLEEDDLDADDEPHGETH